MPSCCAVKTYADLSHTRPETRASWREDVEVPASSYIALLADLKQKNGFAMATHEFQFMNAQLKEMKALCEEIISLIDKE